MGKRGCPKGRKGFSPSDQSDSVMLHSYNPLKFSSGFFETMV